MDLQPDTLPTLARIYLQTFALAALFILSGQGLVRKLLPDDHPPPLALLYGGAYYLGLCLFLILFVLLARGTGSARLGLWLTLAALAVVPLGKLLFRPGAPVSWRNHFLLAMALLGLVGFFSITNATCWLGDDPVHPVPPPTMSANFGTIHSGRYANYALHIAEHDRIPFLAQNFGQSLLTACHLLLGSGAPLAAQMVWLPFSLAALACLVFGVLRAQGLSPAVGLIGTFFILYCNLALSLVYVLVLDNGSPIGFMGYTDILVGTATYLLAGLGLRSLLLAPGSRRWSALLPALIFGIAWAWCAPQNVVVAAAAGGGTGLLWLCSRGVDRMALLGRLGAGGVVCAAGVALGASQLGAFLPSAWREEIQAPVYNVDTDVRLRPYLEYVLTHWTALRSQATTLPYLTHFQYDHVRSPAVAFCDEVWLVETHLWTGLGWGLRLYGFLLLGLLLLWRRGHSARCSNAESLELHPWFWMGLFSFLTGFALVFLLEVGWFKWWLTRFLAPATILCLTGLVLAMGVGAGTARMWKWRVGWALLLVCGTLGPLVEFGRIFHRQWIELAKIDPLNRRLNLLVHSPGPFTDLVEP